jgi:hypothetical protein
MLFMFFIAMMMGVQLARFGTMMGGMRAMPRGAMRMMRRCIGVVLFIVFGGLAVMMGRFFVMLGGGMVMGAGGMLMRHEALLWLETSTHTIHAK